jgi:NTP pyrophosphatase (non-canonical NTP hydrolase)
MADVLEELLGVIAQLGGDPEQRSDHTLKTARAALIEHVRWMELRAVQEFIWDVNNHGALEAVERRREQWGNELDQLAPGAVSITAWVKNIHDCNVAKGWDEPLCTKPAEGDEPPLDVNVYNVLAKLALVHSEVSEALEAARERQWLETFAPNGKPEGFVTELADAVIRIFHICAQLGLDIEGALKRKVDFNWTRSFRHGGKAA